MVRISKRMASRRLLLALGLIVLLVAGAVGTSLASATNPKVSAQAIDYTKLVIGTTTSMQDSGALDNVIVPAFQKLHPEVTLTYLAQGSGKVLTNAKAGQFAALIVHAPRQESDFMTAGYGTMRLPFAYNYFTVVGPNGGPIWYVERSTTAAAAFRRIYALANYYYKNHPGTKRVFFVSRGDSSGTNEAELKLWHQAGVTKSALQAPTAPWYITTGQGMLATLQVASQKRAYTLTDTATYIVNKATLSLFPKLTKLADLKNQYDVIIVNQAMFTSLGTRIAGSDNSTAAEQLAAWLVSANGQAALASYRFHGARLFYPDAYTVSTYHAVATP